MKKIYKGIKYIFSIPKTIFFNFRVFPMLTAIKLPVFVTKSVNCRDVYKGCIDIQCEVKPFMVTIGTGGSRAISSKKGVVHISKKRKAKIVFKGKANFAEGIVLYVNNGNLIFGKNFSANRNCFISSDNDMTFGDDVLLGWNVNIRDSDGHQILYERAKNKCPKVQIGNHVWICSNVDILKGTKINNECIVAYRSCVTGLEVNSTNNLIGGYPAKILKNNVTWKK